MGSLRGFSLLRRPLLLLVTSLVFSGVFCSSSGAPALCDVSCCSVLPSCDNAQLVTCDCPDMDSITIREGDIPVTVQTFGIFNMTHVTIDKDAINGLLSLNSFTLSDIGNLKIKQDGMASQEESELRSVKIQNIGSLQVNSKAFSGVWQSRTAISIHHISELFVKSHAFHYHAPKIGPSVSLKNVTKLKLKSAGFAAPIFYLDLINVNLEVCRHRSFGGLTSHIELNNVTIVKAKAKCFHGENNLAAFNIQSLTMVNVHPQAFSGDMNTLLIKDSNITTIHTRGFDITVTSMALSSSNIGELLSKGLSILASDTLKLDTVRVESLRRNALAGLQIKRSKEEFDQQIVIRKLKLIDLENGSLTFSECAQIHLTDLDLKALDPPICPTEKLTQALGGSNDDSHHTPAQHEIFEQLSLLKMCSKHGFLTSVKSTGCSTLVKSHYQRRDRQNAVNRGEEIYHRDDTQNTPRHDGSDQASSGVQLNVDQIGKLVLCIVVSAMVLVW